MDLCLTRVTSKYNMYDRIDMVQTFNTEVTKVRSVSIENFRIEKNLINQICTR